MSDPRLEHTESIEPREVDPEPAKKVKSRRPASTIRPLPARARISLSAYFDLLEIRADGKFLHGRHRFPAAAIESMAVGFSLGYITPALLGALSNVFDQANPHAQDRITSLLRHRYNIRSDRRSVIIC